MKLLLYLLLIGGALSLAIAATSSSTSPKSTIGTTIATVKPETEKQWMDHLFDFVTRGVSLNLTIWNWESIPADQLKGHLTNPKIIGDDIFSDKYNNQTFPVPQSLKRVNGESQYDVYIYYTDKDVARLAHLNHDKFLFNRSAPMEDIYEQTLMYEKIYAEVIHVEEQYTFTHTLKNKFSNYLMPDVQSILKKLPDGFNGTPANVANYTPHHAFIQKYGTHYISSFSIGGVAHLQAWISPKYFADSLKYNVSKLDELLEQKYHYDLYGFGSEPAELVDPKNQNNLGWRFYGGNTALTNPKEWNATIHTNRTIIDATFTRINITNGQTNATEIEYFRNTLIRYRNTFQKSKGLPSTMFPVGPYPLLDPDFLINVTDRYLQMTPFPDRKFNNDMYDKKVEQVFLEFLNYTMTNRTMM